MTRVLLAAPASGSGKTAVTCALLAALRRLGRRPCAFKCGPDYIDPMFHRAVLGVESRNLDLFLSGPETLRQQFARGAQGCDAAVCEGVMGFYDGVGGSTDRASAWHVADTLNLPVILVVRPKGASLTLAAQINGLRSFRENSHLAGVILNDCPPPLFNTLAPMLERETGLAALGCLPHLPQAEIKSRHLGLYTAAEVRDLSEKIDLLAGALAEHVDLERLLALCEGEAPDSGPPGPPPPKTAPIAVARDEAFCFCYRETLETLEEQGGELVYFSPLHDGALPEGAGGLYLPGGYPELYAQALSKNERMRRAVREAVASGMPTVAECGGFLYLGRSLRDASGADWPMAGCLPGSGFSAGKLTRFGYAQLTAKEDSLLLRRGETVPVHEFHHWDSTENGDAFAMEKPLSGRAWTCGFGGRTLYAAFPHLYFAGQPRMARRFVEAARQHLGKGEEDDEHQGSAR